MSGCSLAERVVLSAESGSAIPNTIGVILAAGLGQRLLPLTNQIPKPLLPLLNCPLVWWNIADLRAHGISRFILNTHHLPLAFEALSREAAFLGLQLDLVNEPALTGPFGGVVACHNAINSMGDDLLVLAGDGLYDADLYDLIEKHRAASALVTIGVAAVPDGCRYGVLDVSDDGVVRGMVEKPASVGAVRTASCGIYVVSPRTFANLPAPQMSLDWIDVVTHLIKTEGTVRAVEVRGWIDVGTIKALLGINQRHLTPNTLRRVSDQLHRTADGSVWGQGSVSIPETTSFKGHVLVGDRAYIGERVTIIDSVIGSHARIGDDVVLQRALVMPGATVSRGSIVVDQIAT